MVGFGRVLCAAEIRVPTSASGPVAGHRTGGRAHPRPGSAEGVTPPSRRGGRCAHEGDRRLRGGLERYFFPSFGSCDQRAQEPIVKRVAGFEATELTKIGRAHV